MHLESKQITWAGGMAVLLFAGFSEPARAQRPANEARLSTWLEAVRQGERDVLVANGAGGMEPARRCATPSGDPEWRAGVEQSLALFRELFPETEQRARTIPLAFHIVHKKNGEGNLTDEEVLEQIDVLNDGYEDADFTFAPVTIDRKKKKKWFKKCDGENPFIKMTTNLAIDPAHTLNIYSCRPRGGILGFAILPGIFPEDDPFNAVVLHYGTLPGGFLFPYDEGDTGTHEVGHYCGLLHTFENGCNAPGDEVNDTNYEAEPAFGCPEGRNTCSQPGNDPVHNFMDYTDDSCMNKFSSGQRGRMNDMLDMFRPSLGN